MNPVPETHPTPADKQMRAWVVACHASSLLGFFVPAGGHILPPLIVWLVKRAESAEVDAHGKESLNFQLSMLIYSIVAAILMFVLIGFVLLPLLHVANLVLVIIASLRASEGQLYRYPLTIRFLK
ncbi:MAG TPA: DUF4870 domain-containing protein [Chthoniobacterales bacterium]|nr:DUF4870 domain-containing protein [Chthoniobacterales bacterium]